MKISEPEYVKKFLEQIPKFSKIGNSAVNYSLQNIRQFCSILGNPHQKVTYIHVAGTNGKGSVCRILSSVLQSMGKKVGLFTSPHLNRFNERFRVNSIPIDYAELEKFIQQYGKKAKANKLSYFEMSTAMAFWVFNKKKVDIGILETGLGGRLDATNIVDPIVSIITSIGRDHEDILGKGIENIAREKAGVIKQNRPVFVGNLSPKAVYVISKIAEKKTSSLYKLPDYHFNCTTRQLTFKYLKKSRELILPFIAPVQAHNLVLAYTALHEVCNLKNWSFNDTLVQAGLNAHQRRFPQTGCFEKLAPGLPWYYDGAHNAEAIEHLKEAITQIAPVEQWTIVFTLMKDKLSRELLHHFLGFKRIYYYPMCSNRTAPIDTVTTLLPKAERFPLMAKERLNSSFVGNLKSQLVLFTGSFYFYNQIRGWVDHIISEK